MALELIGEGFALHLEDLATMEKAVAIYRLWLMPQCPFGWDIGVQLMRQMSGLFEAKRVPEGKAQAVASIVQRHIELMKSVLAMFQEVLANEALNFEHKKELARVIIGISDSLLREPPCSVSTLSVKDHAVTEQPGYLANELVDQLAVLALNALLKVYSDGVWSHMERSFSSWMMHRIQVVLVWTALGVALTERAACILYQGSSEMRLNLPWQVEVDDHYAVYAWTRVHRLLPKERLASLPAPIFIRAVYVWVVQCSLCRASIGWCRCSMHSGRRPRHRPPRRASFPP